MKRLLIAVPVTLFSLCCLWPASHAEENAFAWPETTREMRPWVYWWWMGSAVDRENMARVLDSYRDAGLGGMTIVPIYGVKDEEARYLEHLSPAWMDMLGFTVREAGARDLGVDMSTCTGWPFGGPAVTPDMAAAKLEVQELELKAGEGLPKLGLEERIEAIGAYSGNGEFIDLTGKADGWAAPAGAWRVLVVRRMGTDQQVKRSAPGGAGKVLDPYSTQSLDTYLSRFTDAFAQCPDRPRAQYHDSFEYYAANWTPGFLDAFRARRGYDLLPHLPQLLSKTPDDTAARITSDYRQTVAELHLDYIRAWVDWSHRMGCKTRNQAHGAPGSILDLYAAVDIPETEIFGPSGFPIPGLRADPNFQGDRPHPLMIKFATSAAHVAGRPLIASESCTWMAEHFQESLAQAKAEIDQLFACGLNHLFFHGVAYSPPDAPWPGWLFYASTNFGPSGLWHDLPAFNAYIARCQSVLQSGAPSNDVLLYFPIHDIWHANAAEASLRPLRVHNISEWIDTGGWGPIAQRLWDRGYGFDYVSDALLEAGQAGPGTVNTPGGAYRVLLFPPCRFLPEGTLRKALELADGGATVVFTGDMPREVPGFGNLETRQTEYNDQVARLLFGAPDASGIREAALGTGRVIIVPEVEAGLARAGVLHEAMADAGLRFCRRTREGGYHYFVANLTGAAVERWVPLATPAQSVVILDPRVADRSGLAALRHNADGIAECYLQLAPGESCILRTFTDQRIDGLPWRYSTPRAEESVALPGPWRVSFIEGGPELPPPFEADTLGSWTAQGGAAENFAGTARYETVFELPATPAAAWWLDLGRVCESARVSVNGAPAETVFSFPFRLDITRLLKPGQNTLVVEVTNAGANRVRDLDRRGVEWKRFHDANYVNINYKPFDASAWPVTDSGLIGPVALVPGAAPDMGPVHELADLAEVAGGWRGGIIAEVDESYAGWDVEIGDADNDGANEVLFTGCPRSRLYLSKRVGEAWETRMLAEDLAHRAPAPGMGLVVKVVDLNGDQKNEVVVGTGQEGNTAGPAFCYVLETDGRAITKQVSAQAVMADSLYTHNAAFYDLDKDGVLEILSAYCGTGEVTRFDTDAAFTKMERRQLYLAEGSGEDSFIADIDNDGRVEYLMCDCYRKDQARVHIFEFDDAGELVQPPRVTIEGYKDMKCFNSSIEIGDVDNDGKLDLIVAWKPQWGVNVGTLIGYRVTAEGAEERYVFAREDPALDLGYGEKMMCVADADNDGKNDLLTTTRGEPPWNGDGLGHVFLFTVGDTGEISRELLLNFHPGRGDSSWPAVGDADNDGQNEVIVATGVGHRERPGLSHVVWLERE